ncbi:hypothetical protein BGX26_009405 [Mortierella sp. AD094]|nr:hypothetical protein BGX26_009405 [Mortierella sp. AD094]
MSFIYNYFTNGNDTSADSEGTAALQAIKDQKTTLKTECLQYEVEYRQVMKDSDADSREPIKREVETTTATEAFANSNARIKANIDELRALMIAASTSFIDSESRSGFPVEKQLESVVA